MRVYSSCQYHGSVADIARSAGLTRLKFSAWAVNSSYVFTMKVRRMPARGLGSLQYERLLQCTRYAGAMIVDMNCKGLHYNKENLLTPWFFL